MEGFGKVACVLLAGLVIWAAWRSGWPPRLFLVRLDRGAPRVAAGTVTAAFLQRLGEVAKEHGIAAGWVAGVARGPHTGLEFSRHFPESARQQLRNWWAVSGWRAGKTRR